MQTDPSYDVRVAACQAIGSLGPTARQALPGIDGILRQEPHDPGTNPSEEQLRRCLRDTKAKISR
jgi:hypothetical protein